MALTIRRWLLTMIFLLIPLHSSDFMDTIVAAWEDFLYHFGWGFNKDDLAYYDPAVCSVMNRDFFFGSMGIAAKWQYGVANVIHYTARSDFKKIREHILSAFSQSKWDKQITLENIVGVKDKNDEYAGLLRKDNLPNFVGNLVGVGANEFKTLKEEKYALMIGSDFMEPCRWEGKTPKIITYSFTADTSWAGIHGGEFEFHILQGLNCGGGRFSGWFDGQKIKSRKWLEEEAKKQDSPISKDFKQHKARVRKDGVPNAGIDISGSSPMGTLNSGGFFKQPPPDNKWTQAGEVFTSALLTPDDTVQKICGVFICRNKMMACKVHVHEFTVSDIAGEVVEPWENTPLFGLSTMDIFTVAMLPFSLLFFCCQCFCCCQICVMELNAGVIDEGAIFEENLKRDYKKRMDKTAAKRRKKKRKRRSKR